MNRYFRLAKSIALLKNDKRSYKLGAVAIRKDGVIVGACNAPTKDPEPKAHAEARLCRKMGFNATVYVVRVLRTGNKYAMAKPCDNCMRLMRAMKVKKIYYTINDVEYGVIKYN